MAKTAQVLCDETDIDFIDINVGFFFLQRTPRWLICLILLSDVSVSPFADHLPPHYPPPI